MLADLCSLITFMFADSKIFCSEECASLPQDIAADFDGEVGRLQCIQRVFRPESNTLRRWITEVQGQGRRDAMRY